MIAAEEAFFFFATALRPELVIFVILLACLVKIYFFLLRCNLLLEWQRNVLLLFFGEKHETAFFSSFYFFCCFRIHHRFRATTPTQLDRVISEEKAFFPYHCWHPGVVAQFSSFRNVLSPSIFHSILISALALVSPLPCRLCCSTDFGFFVQRPGVRARKCFSHERSKYQ